MAKLHDLQEKRNNIAIQMRELHDKTQPNAWKEEQRKQWGDMKNAITEIDAQINIEKELRSIESVEKESKIITPLEDNKTTHDTAFRSLLTNGYNSLTSSEKSAIAELRALSKGDNVKGGYTTPTSFMDTVLAGMKAYGGVANVCQVLNTADGRDLQWATANTTDEVGVMLGENTQVDDGDTSFGSAVIGALTMTSKIIKVSNSLLADSGIDLSAYLANLVAERIGRGEANMIINGSGAGTPKQPKGLAGAIKGKIEVATKDVFTWNTISELYHSIDPAYRDSNSFRFVFNDNTFRDIKNLTDKQGRPLWLPDVVGHAPATILGKAYVIDQSVADATAGKVFIYAGDFNKFILRRVNNMTITRLTERYADFDQTGFVAFHRFDTLLTDTAAIKGIVCKA